MFNRSSLTTAITTTTSAAAAATTTTTSYFFTTTAVAIVGLLHLVPQLLRPLLQQIAIDNDDAIDVEDNELCQYNNNDKLIYPDDTIEA